MSKPIIFVHMGYYNVQKGYVLYDITNKKFFVNRDVIFQGGEFSFQKRDTIDLPLFKNTDSDLHTSEDWIDHIHINLKQETTSEEGQETEVTKINRLEGQELPKPVVMDQPAQIVNDRELQRKSYRSTKPPIWMKDFVSLNVHQDKKYGLNKYVPYDGLNDKYQAYLSNMSKVTEPQSFYEASLDPR